VSAVILVEGESDRIALETLAQRLRRSVEIVPMGGAQAIGVYLSRFRHRRVAGLCDAGEEEIFHRAFEHAASLGVACLGYQVCVRDLEDELIRANTAGGVEAVLEAQGDLHAFRMFQKQPAWRGRRIESQLRRFMGSADRRKLRYARLLVEALDLADVPRPLDAVLASVGR